MKNQIIDVVTNPLFYTPILTIAGAVAGSWLTYIFALRRFHREKQYENKLNRYLVLVDKMRGFVKTRDDTPALSDSEDRKKFTDSYRTIWLYGSASVIKQVSKFLKIVTNAPEGSDEREAAQLIAKSTLKQAIIEMRKDLRASGKLRENDFDIFI